MSVLLMGKESLSPSAQVGLVSPLGGRDGEEILSDRVIGGSSVDKDHCTISFHPAQMRQMRLDMGSREGKSEAGSAAHLIGNTNHRERLQEGRPHRLLHGLGVSLKQHD